MYQVIFHLSLKKSNHISSERSNQMTRAEIDWLYPTVHVKDQVLGNVIGGTFSDSQQNLSPHPHYQDILQSTFNQIWDFLPSCWGCLLTLWLKTCVPNNNFGFSGDNCYIKLPVKFCLHSFEWYSLQIIRDAEYFFFSCPRHCDWELIIIIVYYFQIWNKKEHIIICWVIKSHGSHVYWDTLYKLLSYACIFKL